MRPILRLAAFGAAVVACTALASPKGLPFKAPEVISATDAYISYQVVLDGFVVLEAFLGSEGTLRETKVLRDPGTMVSAAVASIRTWKFRPAEGDAHPLPSAITAIFVYRPPNNGPASVLPPKDFKPVVPHPVPHADGDPGYVAPGVVSVVYPDYPVNSVAWGSVIVQVTVSPEGEPENTRVLHGVAPFTNLALNALQKWRFLPATLAGKPIASQVPVAFVFQSPSP